MAPSGTKARVSLWCVPAARARVIAVLATVAEGQRSAWRHVLRWRPGHAPEPGAWTKLRLLRHRCRVDAEGEFFVYTAKDGGGPWGRPGAGPFDASSGGAVAVSRLPWLSALTDIKPASVMGGGESRHALSEDDQRRLWRRFDDAHDLYVSPWFFRQQAGWTQLTRAESPLRCTSKDLVGRQSVEAPRGRCVHLLMRLKDGGASGRSVSTSDCAFFLCEAPASGLLAQDAAIDASGGTPDGEAPVPVRLAGVVWARLDEGPLLLVATDDARLRAYRPRPGAVRAGVPLSDLAGAWKVVEEHDLSALEPAPKASPLWARAPLDAPASAGRRAGPKGKKPTPPRRRGPSPDEE